MARINFTFMVSTQYNRREIHGNIIDIIQQLKETSSAPNLQNAVYYCGKVFYVRRAFNNTRHAKTRTPAAS